MDQWSELLDDLLIMIDENLPLYPDKLRFRCVCTHWRSAPPVELPDLRGPQPPWLLLPYASGSLCGLYHPFENKVYEVDLPEVGEKVFKGSCYGWVVAVQLNGSIDVVNPLTRARVPLPPRYTFPNVVEYCPDDHGEEYVVQDDDPDDDDPYILDSMNVRYKQTTKIALSCSPSSGEFFAVAQYQNVRLAYCKSGDGSWRELLDFDDKRRRYDDIIFRDGKLYALTTKGNLMICRDIASCPSLRKYVSFPRWFSWLGSLHHLINSSRGLLLVGRGYDEKWVPVPEGSERLYGTMIEKYNEGDDDKKGLDLTLHTIGFGVFEVNMRLGHLVGLVGLDDEILFMGLGTQLSISSKSFRGRNKNRIYFANHSFDLKEHT